MMNIMKNIKLINVVLIALLLSACSTRNETFTDLQVFVAEVNSRPGAEVEPVPTFEDYEAFTYSAAGFRGPFEIPVVVSHSDGSRNSKNVKPDLDRLRDPMEEHPIAELAMVGMLERNEVFVALISDGIGDVHRIMLGNYLGRNHGKVVSITDTQLDLIEIVPSGDGGWVERPQSLALLR